MGLSPFPPPHAKAWIWVFGLLFISLTFQPNVIRAFEYPDLSIDTSPIFLAQAQPPASQGKEGKEGENKPAEGDAAAADAEEEEEDEEEGPARIPLAGVAQGGVLLQRDQLVLEPTLGYSFSSNSRLILTGFSILPLLVLGTIEAEKVETQTFAPSIGFRYGIRRGIQFDIRIPAVVSSQTRVRVLSDETGQEAFSGEDAGISDVSFGLSYQFLYERAWIPDMVFRLGVTAPTGRSQFDIFEDIIAAGNFQTIDQFEEQLTSQGSALGGGRWVVDGTFTGVKALDPAILFGTVGVSYSPPVTETLLALSANPVNPMEIIVVPVESDLGGTTAFSTSLGMAISLNNQLSMNWSFANSYRFAQESNGVKIPDSQVQSASFSMGLNIAVTPRITTNLVGSIGITPDSPDFAFSLTVPVSFTNAIGSTVTWIKEHRPFKSTPAAAIPEAAEEEAPAAPKAPASPPTKKSPSTGSTTSSPSNGGNGNGGPPSTKEPQK